MSEHQLEIRRLKELIKNLMRKKGYKYSDLAGSLGVSVTTVKRMLNENDMPLSRFFQITEWLGLSLSEIASLTGDGQERFPELTESQEAFLAENPEYAVILDDLLAGVSVQQIQERHQLSEASMQKYLRRLDRVNLIELQPNGQVRQVIRNLKVPRGGPFSRRVAEPLGEIAKEAVTKGLVSGDHLPKFSFHFNTNLRMRKKTLRQLHEEVAELALKYNTIATTEEAVTTLDDLVPVVWIFNVQNAEMNTRIFGQPKNI